MPLWAEKLLVGVGQGSQLARLVSPSICAVLASRLPGQSPTRYLVWLPPSVPNTCTGDPQKALPYCDPHSASTRTFEPCRTRQEDAALTAFGWTKQVTYFPSEPLRGFLAVRPRGGKTLDSRVSCPFEAADGSKIADSDAFANSLGVNAAASHGGVLVKFVDDQDIAQAQLTCGVQPLQ